MKPRTPHWADITAAKVIAEKGPKERYVVASGITPSGTVHIGNFREVITVDFVARALRDTGASVRFIYSWDDFDTFRKVPVNLPNQEMLMENLRRPISRIPDPRGQCETYARAGTEPFERDLQRVGIAPEFLYQERRYAAHMYADGMRQALLRRGAIKAILDRYRAEPLADDWLPTAAYCGKCGRDTMDYEKFDGEWGYLYRCSTCGHEAKEDLRETSNVKLNWRTDWPMRWAFEGVDFEPGGKDHSSQGGSYDTAKEIVKAVYERDPPVYLQYDFVSIKGLDGKMSSSAGVLITLSEALEVYPGEIVRWIFARQRPNTDFALAFDQDVIKTYDEFDRCEEQAFVAGSWQDGKWAMNRRNYELALVSGIVPSQKPVRPAFRELCNRLQICDGNADQTRARYYAQEVTSAEDIERFRERCRCAWFWLEKHAPDEFRYRLQQKRQDLPLSEGLQAGVAALRELVATTDLDAIAPKDLNQLIYDRAIHGAEIDSKEFFTAVYRKLIGRDQGPRLPGFLKEIGRERLLELL